MSKLKRIEKYNINDLYSGNSKKDFTSYELWWKREIEPINELLDKAEPITGPIWRLKPNKDFMENDYIVSPNEQAYIIGVAPIKKQTREEKLENFIKDFIAQDEYDGCLPKDFICRAKALLEGEK